MDGTTFAGKSAWLRQHLVDGDSAIAVGPALSFIGEAKQVGPVSAHPYNQSAVALLREVERAGGMALDCGAGRRDFVSEHLVQIDVMPYANIDVLCDAERLPFADASFDLVMSFAVLEHISNPFNAASEIKRVLKPGGIVYVDVPQIATLHGYPSHFFNVTRFGLLKLFEGLDCRAHAVPPSGHPTVALHTVLSAFRGGLPRDERVKFDQMTVAEIMAIPPKELRKQMCQNFHPEVKWKVAATTCALFQKPGPASFDISMADLPQFHY